MVKYFFFKKYRDVHKVVKTRQLGRENRTLNNGKVYNPLSFIWVRI